MTFSAIKCATLIAVSLFATCSPAASEEHLCMELSRHIDGHSRLKLPRATRNPTSAEQSIIENSKVESLERTGVTKGVAIVDADNDGIDDVLVWTIEGSGNFVYGELFDMRSSQASDAKSLIPAVSLQMGAGDDPQFVRLKGVNYLVSSDSGLADDLTVQRLSKKENGQYEMHELCRMDIVPEASTDCRHPACRTLTRIIEKNENRDFVVTSRPYPTMSPIGLWVYFPADGGSIADFDNTKNPTTIWRIYPDDEAYKGLGWHWLSQSNERPYIDPSLQPTSPYGRTRNVLLGPQHNRLRRALAQQSEALSRRLHRPISLPSDGEFFFFIANQNRTYWAWDLGEPPYSEEILITYSNAKRSDYIGMVKIKRDHKFKPCESSCVTPLDRREGIR